MLAALFTAEGRIVTGRHHGEAFSKLSQEEMENFYSGFLDPEKKKFIREDDQVVYLKRILCIRHAEIDDTTFDPQINQTGRAHARRTARFLFEHFDLRDFKFLASPVRRCQQTAEIISDETKVTFEVCEKLTERSEQESHVNFRSRLLEILDLIPENTAIISHCDLISHLVSLCSNKAIGQIKCPYASVQYVNCGSVELLDYV